MEQEDYNYHINFDFASLYPTTFKSENDEAMKSIYEERIRLKRIRERRLKLERILNNIGND